MAPFSRYNEIYYWPVMCGLRDQVWALYRDLKHWKLTTTEADRPILVKRFGEIFGQRSGNMDLDQLLVRRHRWKD